MADASRLPAGCSNPAARERFFIECDTEGRVLWMNAHARERLGGADNLLSAIEPLLAAQLRERAPDAQGSAIRQSDGMEVLPRNPSSKPAELAVTKRQAKRRTRRRRPSRVRLAEQISRRVEDERSRLARDLHAGAGQSLVAIKLNVSALRAALPGAPESVRENLSRIEWLAEQALEEVRSTSQRLHPPDWEQLGLRESIERLWETSGMSRNFHGRLEFRSIPPMLPQAVKVAVYRCAQEGIANVLRHSKASEVSLVLERVRGRLELTLQDNGTGIDMERTSSPVPEPRGIGLRSMRREVRALNGEFRIQSGPDGTVMKIGLPVRED